MNQTIRILHLEDDPVDIKLVQATLKSAGIDSQLTPVQSRNEFEGQLRNGEYDVILADYHLPAYDGLSALRLKKEIRPEVPFIFVSGTMGEDAAIEALTGGRRIMCPKQSFFASFRQ